MFLFINSIVASLDGLIIGIGLRLSNQKLSKKNFFTILIGNILIYTFFLFFYKYFKCTFMTKNVTTILYLLLAWSAFHSNDSFSFHDKSLSFLNCLLLTVTHSLDGTLISLHFVYTYKLFLISFLFGCMSLLILLIGYYFAKPLQFNKKSKYISTFLFFLLAFINQFF